MKIKKLTETYTVKNRGYSGETWYTEHETGLYTVGKKTFFSLDSAKRYVNGLKNPTKLAKLKKQKTSISKQIKQLSNKLDKIEHELYKLGVD